jgi:hypothetical protein
MQHTLPSKELMTCDNCASSDAMPAASKTPFTSAADGEALPPTTNIK